ncbi:protein-disulfide reductase DsbD domain-containing protein [Tranquillimonas alkanivorans]|nr:protein-disulfide reductase DsbD domain-containing protein [Tranquillimonas alkanivorans]
MTLAAALCAALAAPAPAQSVDDIAQVRMLPGWRTDAGRHMAAIEITLAPGWKTYWRAPGEAGIPPSFDWSGSQNLRTVAYHWPVPEVFDLNGMTSIGYDGHLVLPIEMTPASADAPIRAAARIDMGVCRDVCVPLTVEVAGDLPPTGGHRDARIVAALSDRPFAAAEAGVGAVDCEVAPLEDGLRLTARVDVPALGGQEFAVIEAADPALWVSESDTRRVGDTLTAQVDIVPPRGTPLAFDRSAVRITVLGTTGAVDIQGCD